MEAVEAAVLARPAWLEELRGCDPTSLGRWLTRQPERYERLRR